MAYAVSHSLGEILAFWLLMQHAVSVSTVRCVEQATAAEERLGRASWSWRKKAKLMQGEANPCGELSTVLPKLSWNVPQVGAFGLA